MRLSLKSPDTRERAQRFLPLKPEARQGQPRNPDLRNQPHDGQGTNTGADTLDDAIGEAADCLGSYLAMLIANHEPIPEPSAPKGNGA
jgi:hypothetical protein